MKYITLIRHAKSDWSLTDQKDIERTLNLRGKRDAPVMGKKLFDLNLLPNKIFVSPAERTRETCNLLVEQLDYPLGEVNEVDEIYEASVGSLLNFINRLDNQFHDVAIIGHNPSISYLTEYLTGTEIGNVPTCGVIRMKFDFEDWELISKDTADLIYFIYPKQLEE